MLMVTPTSRLLLFRLYASSCFLFSYHVVAGAAESPFFFSFDLSKGYTPGFDKLRFEGTAGLHDGLVDLTNNLLTKPVGNCTGRLSYYDAVPFYVTTTGYVASFSTRFRFAIKVVNTSGASTGRGRGMTFFLSDYPLAPLKSCRGNGDGMNSEGMNPIVAVEFDTIGNAHDPSAGHIGIYIKSAEATVNTTSLPNLNGSMTASITFNSGTGMLVASLHFDDNPSRGSYQVSTRLTNPVTAWLPSEWVAVGFSAATGTNIELQQILSWSFNSTLDWFTYIDARKGVTGIDIYALLTDGFIILVLIFYAVLIWIFVARCKHIRYADSFVNGAGDLAKRFEYQELADATDKFSERRRLGHGNFGIVYEGKLMERDGQYHQVAVKKIKGFDGSFQDFHAELKTISATSHKNLVKLKGWCSQNNSNLFDFMCWCRQKQRVELFLVYELVPNGNLDMHLNNMELVLQWKIRYNIAKGIGLALWYLHHECKPCILHRDIKPANILLDEQFNAKLGDFGLSRIAHKRNEVFRKIATEMIEGDLDANSVALTTAIGTRAYMDPRCKKNGIVSFDRSSDVYSFGIVLLEIACNTKVREKVWDLYKQNPENMVAAADTRLNGGFDVAEMHRVAVLGLWCSVLDGARRPSMVQAMKVLEGRQTLPNLIEYDSEVAASEGNESEPLL